MNLVEWLQNLLHSINPTWVWIGLGYLVCVFLIMKLMQAKGMAERKAEHWRRVWFDEVSRQDLQASSTGPAVTARTLMDELRD